VGLERPAHDHLAHHTQQPRYRRARTRLDAPGPSSVLHEGYQGSQRHFHHQARAETVATSRTYREPFKKRRCLVPASGFYEWKRLDPKNKQLFAFDLANGKMMAFAGLWDAWKDPANGRWLQSYAIITTDANELMAPVHDRMPVILHPGDFSRWLDRDSDRLGLRLTCCALSPPTRWKPSRSAPM